MLAVLAQELVVIEVLTLELAIHILWSFSSSQTLDLDRPLAL